VLVCPGQVKFIRDDERFSDPALPVRLQFFLTSLRTPGDATDIAQDLETFFEDDPSLMAFARWLRVSAKYCCKYRLSW
jgi:hypothetical protein